MPHNEDFDSNWPRTRKFSQLLQAGKYSSFWLFSPWSRSTSNFYALIGQNLTGEFVRKIYAASWNLFTLTAEADGVLCQLVMFLTAFFYWMYKKWNSAAIKSLLLFVASLFNGFLVEKYVACQSRKSDLGWHRFRFYLVWCLKGLKSLKRFRPYLIASRSCILNGKPEWLLYLIENVTVKKTFAGTNQTTWNRVKLRYFDWPIPVFVFIVVDVCFLYLI